jgi:hypothetical protein
MTRKVLIVAALLFSNLAGIAAAADNPEHKSKNARKLIATLDSIGINNHEVLYLINAADARVEKNYFYFGEQKMANGRLALRYHLGGTNTAETPGGSKRLELHYAPQDSHMQITARTNSLMINYHFELK